MKQGVVDLTLTLTLTLTLIGMKQGVVEHQQIINLVSALQDAYKERAKPSKNNATQKEVDDGSGSLTMSEGSLLPQRRDPPPPAILGAVAPSTATAHAEAVARGMILTTEAFEAWSLENGLLTLTLTLTLTLI